MKNLIFFFLFFFCSISNFAQPDSILIEFNGYTDGDLHGQDGWVTVNQTTGPSDMIVATAVGNVVTPDGTKGIYYNTSGAGFGRTATKKDFGDFELGLSNGGIIEMEMDIHRNWCW